MMLFLSLGCVASILLLSRLVQYETDDIYERCDDEWEQWRLKVRSFYESCTTEPSLLSRSRRLFFVTMQQKQCAVFLLLIRSVDLFVVETKEQKEK